MLFIWTAAATLLVGMRFATGLDQISNAVRRQPSESRTSEILSAESAHLVRRTRKAIVGVETSGRVTGAISFDGCKTQHPAHHSDVLRMTPREVMDCYAQWHGATLAAWNEEPEKCEGRHVQIHKADHGLGDSGGAFAGHFASALVGGDMLFWLFPEHPTVWQLAMAAPFDWDLKAHAHLLCLGDDALRDLDKSTQGGGHVVAKCPNCAYPKDILQTTSSFSGTGKEVWEFLYRPTVEVRQMVQDVVQQVQSGERLIGVHFRAQWFGEHHGCGCLDAKEAPQCLSNIGSVLQQRGLPGFEAGPRLRYFVASDEFAGLDAFRETFRQELVTLRDALPLEHSLDVSAAGAKRIYAEFLILSNASAILGTCGSTFTQRLMTLSGLPEKALIKTGSEESRACAANHKQYDFSSFSFSRFTTTKWSKACGCYGGDESTNTAARAGACAHACKGSKPPPKCSAADFQGGLAESDEMKPAWVPQHRAVADQGLIEADEMKPAWVPQHPAVAA